MVIEFRKNTQKLIEYKGNLLENITESINEAGHVFDRQHDLSDYIAGFIVDAEKKNIPSIKINLKEFNTHLNGIIVNINYNYAYGGVKAQYNGIDQDKNALIDVLFYTHFRLMNYTNKQAKQMVKSAIMHELLHSKMGFSRHKKGKEQFPLPNYYEEIFNLLGRNIEPNSVLYIVAYSLYLINETEIPAFVSQCYSEVYDILINLKVINNQAFKYALSRSNTYDTFVTIKEYLKDVILNKSDKEKEDRIIQLNKFVPSLKIKSLNNLNKLLNTLLYRIQDAIYTCEDCATEAYYKLKGK